MEDPFFHAKFLPHPTGHQHLEFRHIRVGTARSSHGWEDRLVRSSHWHWDWTDGSLFHESMTKSLIPGVTYELCIVFQSQEPTSINYHQESQYVAEDFWNFRLPTVSATCFFSTWIHPLAFLTSSRPANSHQRVGSFSDSLVDDYVFSSEKTSKNLLTSSFCINFLQIFQKKIASEHYFLVIFQPPLSKRSARLAAEKAIPFRLPVPLCFFTKRAFSKQKKRLDSCLIYFWSFYVFIFYFFLIFMSIFWSFFFFLILCWKKVGNMRLSWFFESSTNWFVFCSRLFGMFWSMLEQARMPNW